MKRVLPIILVCLVFLSSCTGKNAESPSPSATFVDEWAEQNDIVLPEAGKADVFVSFDFTTKKLRARYIFNFGEEIESFRFFYNESAKLQNYNAPMSVTYIDHKTKPNDTIYGGFTREKDEEIIFDSPTSVAMIEYTVAVNGFWCNMIDERYVALSTYSAWAIVDSSLPIKYTFHLEGLEDYFVLKSDYDPKRKLWTYRDGYDFANIIAFKHGSYKVSNSGSLNFYTLVDNVLDESGEIFNTRGEIFDRHYKMIIPYYLSIFPEKEIKELDIVVFDLPSKFGDYAYSAYSRKQLVVYDRLNPITPETDLIELDNEYASVLAHELGHNWFSGAAGIASTWEDWLNETGAAWASMLYLLHIGKDDYFDRVFNDRLTYTQTAAEYHNPVDPIKTPDGSRLNNVHYMGTAMFCELYKSRGLDTIMEVMQTLADVMAEGEVTTEKFLAALRSKMGDDIPDRIERGLELMDYSGLFD